MCFLKDGRFDPNAFETEMNDSLNGGGDDSER